MTSAVEYKRLLEEMTSGGWFWDEEDKRPTCEAARWALKEIEFLQGKVKEIRALLAAAEQRAG